MIDLDFFAWRERRVVDGEERLLVPCADDQVYEQSMDFLFATADEAIDAITGLGFDDQYDSDTWVLVRYTGSIVPLERDPFDAGMLCHVCAAPFFIDDTGVAYHCSDDADGIDHDADADHVPYML